VLDWDPAPFPKRRRFAVCSDAVCNAKSGWSREHVLHEDADAPMGRGAFGVSDRLKSIVKHTSWGLGKRMSCANMGGPI